MDIWTLLTLCFFFNMISLSILANRGNKFANSDTGLATIGFCVVGFFICGTIMVLKLLHGLIFQ